jgi:hypothetical protein
MGTQALVVRQNPTQTPPSEEATKDAPVSRQHDPYAEQCAKYGAKLIELQRKIRDTWSWKRRGIVAKCIKHKEMDKGNHFIGFWDDSQQPFDALEEYRNFTGTQQQTDDRSLRRHYSNFYTMLLEAITSVLTSDVPRSQYTPANADDPEDRQTSKVASRIERIIERKNDTDVMLRQEVRELGTSGCYFKYTRYVVDADRTGTHKETTVSISAQEVVPARYLCTNCGQVTPEAALMTQRSLNCPRCGTALGEQNYLESYVDEAPVAEQKSDVPNGMVMQTVYGPLHFDADPDVDALCDSRVNNLSLEVPLGWLRMTFPDHYDSFQQGQSSGSANELLERQYRSLLTTPANYGTWIGYSTPDKLTYSRCWIQPMAYEELDDRELAKDLRKDFPNGLMLAYQDDTPLQVRPAKFTDEWTWCGTKEGYGLFPPALMEPGLSLQERIDDMANVIHDWMDRMAAGILLALEKYIDTKALNGKQMFPGILNAVAMKSNAPPGSIQDMIYQVKMQLEPAIFSYVESLKHDMEVLVGAPPQLFGGQGDPHIETKGGQEQQLSTAMSKLGLYWQCLRKEHSKASENAITCTKRNMTEAWFDVVTDETKEARNEFVHLDEVKGSVRAEPETDQAFPMTWAQIKDFFMNLLDSANQMLLDWLIQEPKNIDTMMRYVGVPGLVAPGQAMRDKALGIFGKIISTKPARQTMPDGTQVVLPSILPNKYLDDLGALEKMIPTWAQEHWDKLENNPDGLANLVAFYQACVQMAKEKAAEMQMNLPGQVTGNGPQATGAPQPAMA